MKKTFIVLFLLLFYKANASAVWDLDWGIEKYNKKDFESAILYFDGYKNANPNDENGYFWLARAYSAKEDYIKSKELYENAYKIAKSDKNLDKITFEDSKYSSDLDDYFDMAAIFYNQGNYKEALNYSDMMIKINPDYAGAYFIKAKVANHYGDKDSAIKYLKKAIILDNSILNTSIAKHLNIAKIPELSEKEYSEFALKSYYQGNITSTIEYCKKYLSFDPKSVDISLLLCDCYLKNNNLEEAKKVLKNAIDLNKNNISLLLKQAEVQKMSNGSDYEKILLNIYSINPNNKKLLLNLANYYLENDDFEKSKTYFKKLITIDDLMYEAYFGYMYSLINLGEDKESISLFKTLKSLNPDTSEIEFIVAKVCEVQANYKEALDYINLALEKEDNPNYRLLAAKYSFILKDYKNAILNLNKIEQQNFKNKNNYLILSYLASNDVKQAKEVVDSEKGLDKNSIIYKYYLYITSKIEGNDKEVSNYLAQINKFKPTQVEEYIDYAKVKFLITNKFEESEKILNKGIKKHNKQLSKEVKLRFARLELCYVAQEADKLKEYLEEFSTKKN